MLSESGIVIPEESFKIEKEKKNSEQEWISLSVDLINHLRITDDEHGIADDSKAVNWAEYYSSCDDDLQYYVEDCELEDEGIRYAEVFLGTHKLLRNAEERLQLQKRYTEAKVNQEQSLCQQIGVHMDRINTEDADWQIKAIQLLYENYGNRVVKQDAEVLWERLAKLFESRFGSSEMALSIKTGVLGPIALRIACGKMGLRSFVPKPEQDSKEKIDLWISGNDPDDGVIATQIKSNFGVAKMDGSLIQGQKRIDPNLPKDLKRWQSGMNKCHAAAQKYEQISGVPVSAFWVEVGLGLDNIVDENTGQLSDRFLQSLQENKLFKNLSDEFLRMKGGAGNA